MNQKKLTVGLFIIVGILFVAINSFFIVSQTQQALVLRFGKPVKVVQSPGISFKTPFIENVEMYDKRLLVFNAEKKEVIASDQKRLVVDAFVRYRITDPLKFKQTVADERTMNLRLNTILESALRQALGSAPLSAVISNERAKMMQQVREIVNLQATGKASKPKEGEDDNAASTSTPRGGFGIEVVDVRIVRADLPEANSQSIYRRMQTERERDAKDLRARGAEDAQKIKAIADKERSIIIAEAQKKAETIRGEGDSEALKIFANAANRSPEFYDFYRSLQAYRKTVSKDNTTVVLSPDSNFLRHME
jgi:membrane protease subunit HflC